MEVTEEDLSDIWYTSGTTGEPKGIMITHRNFIACTQHLLSDVYWITGEDKLLTVAPLAMRDRCGCCPSCFAAR